MKAKYLFIALTLVALVVIAAGFWRKLKRKAMIDTLVEKLGMNRATMETKSDEELRAMVGSIK